MKTALLGHTIFFEGSIPRPEEWPRASVCKLLSRAAAVARVPIEKQESRPSDSTGN